MHFTFCQLLVPMIHVCLFHWPIANVWKSFFIIWRFFAVIVTRVVTWFLIDCYILEFFFLLTNFSVCDTYLRIFAIPLFGLPHLFTTLEDSQNECFHKTVLLLLPNPAEIIPWAWLYLIGTGTGLMGNRRRRACLVHEWTSCLPACLPESHLCLCSIARPSLAGMGINETS